jgi:hypothetical protein
VNTYHGFGPARLRAIVLTDYYCWDCSQLLLKPERASDKLFMPGRRGLDGPARNPLIRLLARFLPIALARQSFFQAALFTRFEVKRVPFNFLNDIFLLDFTFEAAQGVFQRFAFLQSHFSQSTIPPNSPGWTMLSFAVSGEQVKRELTKIESKRGSCEWLKSACLKLRQSMVTALFRRRNLRSRYRVAHPYSFAALSCKTMWASSMALARVISLSSIIPVRAIASASRPDCAVCQPITSQSISGVLG